MTQLRAALDDALSSQGRLVLLAGEPGIGKTRLALEVASHATVLGFRVLWGWCYEAEGAPPYWPWVQPIRSYFQQRDPEQLRSEMGPGAADIAEVIPELGEKLPDLKQPPALEPEQARFRLFDSITTFLKNAAQSQPVMLVLDDLHWADKSSLLLLQFLVRQLGGSRLLIVGCYRDMELSRQHSLSEALAQLAREPVFQRKLLRGLSQEDTGHFIEVTAGAEPPPRLVETVYAHTEGNPFFTKEVVRVLSEQGELMSEMGGPQGISIPEGVREVIGQRLNRLSEQCNQTLATASIIGREFDFKLLKAVTRGTTDDQLLQVVDEALNAHVIEGLPGSGERYQFAHALIQQTLSEEISTSRRVRLHARIGGALEELYGSDASRHAAELAYHFAEAQPVLGTEKLVRYALLAGERALAAYAYEEALAHWQRALVAKGVSLASAEPATDAETAALLYGLGRAQLATLPRHQVQKALASLGRAFDYYAEAGDVPRAVAVAEYPIPGLAGHLMEVVQLIARALTLVQPDSHEAGRLLSHYGRVMGIEKGDYYSAQHAFKRALAIARREGDVALEMWTLANAAQVDIYHLCYQESVVKSLRAIELACRADDPRAEVTARYWTEISLRYMGDLKRAQLHATAMLAVAERLRDRYWLTGALSSNECDSRSRGEWQSARAFSDRGLTLSPQEPRPLFNRVMLEYEAGEFAQGEGYMKQLLEVMRLTPPGPTIVYAFTAIAIPLVARITSVPDRFDVAEAAAATVLSSPFAIPFYSMVARTGLALLAVLRSDMAASAEQYAALESLKGTISIGSAAAVDRLLGLLAQTMGDLDKAAEHFEDALAFCRKAGYRPELAWSCCDYAGTLFQRNGPGDRQEAMGLLDESLKISRELGMRPLAERVQALQQQADSQPIRAPVYPDGLTQREVEVLRLIASGNTNQEIAEALFISPRTVANHVTNVLNKTGAANRAESAAYSVRHGLA